MQHIADLDDQIHAARRDPTNTFPRDRFARGRQNPQTRHSDTHSNGEEAYDEQDGGEVSDRHNHKWFGKPLAARYAGDAAAE